MSKRQDEESAEVEARWTEFWNESKNFDSPWARNILHQLSEFLPFVFKFDAVRHGLEQLYTRSHVKCPSDWDWSKDWTDADEHLPVSTLRQLPIFRLALALNAYAYYGLKLTPNEPDDIHGLDYFLEDLEERMAPSHPKTITLFPHEWGGKEMEETITAALARRKLDHPEKSKGLTPEELAALARVSRKSVMNLVAPGKQGVLQRDAADLITVESATRWLLARSDFRPSVWQRQKDKSLRPRKSAALSIEPLFVPIATDGSWFSPADRSQGDGRYYVTNGEAEQGFEGYWEALEFLARAASPCWRYTDAVGRRRTKLGARWERKERRDVELLLSRVAKAATRKSGAAGGHA